MAFEILQNSSSVSKLFTPDDEEYQESIKSYFTLQESELKPSAVFKPTSATDVAEAVKVLHDANVRNNYSAPFAIRGGGHQAYPGSANIGPGGVTIDLRVLKDISINEDKSLVTVGTGNNFEAVYSFLEPLGLNVPSARVAQVGVAGFVLGGGLSYYTPKLGFVCDNISEFEIVLADGSLIHANASAHSDLFRALKGGGNNFGIVTSMTMRTMPKQDLWGGALINDPSVYSQSVEWMHKQITSSDYDTNAAIMVGLAMLKGQKMAYHSLKYSEPKPDPDVFKGFLELPTLQGAMRKASLKELTVEEGQFTPGGTRCMYMSCSFKSNARMLQDCAGIWEKSLATVSHFAGLEWSFVFNPVTPSAMRVGSNSLGLAEGFEPIVIVLLVGTWDNASDDEEGERAGFAFIDAVCARAKELDCFHPYIYANYAWKDQRVMDGYGNESKERLQEVSRKYDPDGIFQKAVPGGFKLFS